MNSSPYHRFPSATAPLTRRDFLWRSGGGLGGIALAALLGSEQARAVSPSADGVLSGVLHYPPRAKRVVQLLLAAAARHLDMFE